MKKSNLSSRNMIQTILGKYVPAVSGELSFLIVLRIDRVLGHYEMCCEHFILRGRLKYEKLGMFVVSLRGINQEFWSHLGYS